MVIHSDRPVKQISNHLLLAYVHHEPRVYYAFHKIPMRRAQLAVIVQMLMNVFFSRVYLQWSPY